MMFEEFQIFHHLGKFTFQNHGGKIHNITILQIHLCLQLFFPGRQNSSIGSDCNAITWLLLLSMYVFLFLSRFFLLFLISRSTKTLPT